MQARLLRTWDHPICILLIPFSLSFTFMSVLLTCSSLLRSRALHSSRRCGQHRQDQGSVKKPGLEACIAEGGCQRLLLKTRIPSGWWSSAWNGLLAFSIELCPTFVALEMGTPWSAVTGRMTNLKILAVNVDFAPCEDPAPGSHHFHKALFPSVCLNSSIPVCLWSRKWEQKQAESLASWDLIQHCSHEAVQYFGDSSEKKFF